MKKLEKSKSRAPKVSVLTAIFNTDPAHLRECIESVLSQTFSDFEFLILNDSPENKEIEEIAMSYRDKRIIYFKNEKNSGISFSRNKLLEMARGEYVAVLDHDDISMPERLEKESRFLDGNPSVGVVSSWRQYFGDSDFLNKNPESDTLIKINMTDNCQIAHTACMMRRSVLLESGARYRENYSPAEDYKLFADLMEFTDFHNLQEALVKYRWHKLNVTNTQAEKMSAARARIMLEIENKFPAYRRAFEKQSPASGRRGKIKIKLFSVIPLLKIKRNTAYLFGFIPVAKWRCYD